MHRIIAVGVLVATTLTGAATPAHAGLSSNTFGATGSVTADGRLATVSVLLACTAPGSVHFTVTLTQGATTGLGHGGGQCTGQTETFSVRVPATGGAFTPGVAEVCGEAVNQEPDGGRDTRAWCRAGGVQLQS